MRFLHINETVEWCRDHGMAVAADRFALLPDPRLQRETRIVYAPDGPTGREAEALEVCVAMLGRWDECLFWPVGWDTWPSSEDWPSVYATRGARDERRSLAVTPGHLFAATEVEDLRLFLRMAMSAGWDAHILPAKGTVVERRCWNSHDGWLSIHAIAADGPPEPAP